jgi:hypothetical protein
MTGAEGFAELAHQVEDLLGRGAEQAEPELEACT